jgi:hypothetical protein
LDNLLQVAAQAREQMAKLPVASQRDVVMADHTVGPSGPVQHDWVVTERALLRGVKITPLILSKDKMHAAVVVDVLPFAAPAVPGAASAMLTESLLRRLDDLRERVARIKYWDVQGREVEDREEELRKLVAEQRADKRQRRSAEEAGCFSLHAVFVVARSRLL